MSDATAPAVADGARSGAAVKASARAYIVVRPGHGYAVGEKIEDGTGIPNIRDFAVPVGQES